MSRKKTLASEATQATLTQATLTAEAVQRDFDFKFDKFHEFRRADGIPEQMGLRVESRIDPDGRYLLLICWPDSLSRDPHYACLCPPGREANADVVVVGTRVMFGRWAHENLIADQEKEGAV